jgi:hypothetical protein
VVWRQLADLKNGFGGAEEGFEEVFRVKPADQVEIRRV